MKDLERYLKETPKPHISPEHFRADLRRQLLNGAPQPRHWVFKAEMAWLVCLTVVGALFLMIWQPQLAHRAHSLVFGGPQAIKMTADSDPTDVSPVSWTSSDQDRQLFEAWALSQGLEKAPEIKNQQTERLLLRRFVLQDGRMVEVVSRQNDDDIKQQNILY